MELFKDLLFGISGLSLIFWVSVIAMWHVDMFPRIFKAKNENGLLSLTTPGLINNSPSSEIEKGALRPLNIKSTLPDRSKYKRKSILIADFSQIEDGYVVNRLYTAILISIGIVSFILLTYGLQSGFKLFRVMP